MMHYSMQKNLSGTDAPGMGNRGIAKLRAIKSIIKNVQNRPS